MVRETIVEQPDMRVVGEATNEAEILELMERTRPDCLIIGLERSGERPALCDLLLERFPHTRILAISPAGDCSVFYWASLHIHSDPVETSEEGILNAMRKLLPSRVLSAGGMQ
jgi:chemotaxis response regulator CheB